MLWLLSLRLKVMQNLKVIMSRHKSVTYVTDTEAREQRPHNLTTFSRRLTHFVTQITDVVAVTMESATVSHWRKLVFSSLLGFLGRT